MKINTELVVLIIGLFVAMCISLGIKGWVDYNRTQESACRAVGGVIAAPYGGNSVGNWGCYQVQVQVTPLQPHVR